MRQFTSQQNDLLTLIAADNGRNNLELFCENMDLTAVELMPDLQVLKDEGLIIDNGLGTYIFDVKGYAKFLAAWFAEKQTLSIDKQLVSDELWSRENVVRFVGMSALLSSREKGKGNFYENFQQPIVYCLLIARGGSDLFNMMAIAMTKGSQARGFDEETGSKARMALMGCYEELHQLSKMLKFYPRQLEEGIKKLGLG